MTEAQFFQQLVSIILRSHELAAEMLTTVEDAQKEVFPPTVERYVEDIEMRLARIKRLLGER